MLCSKVVNDKILKKKKVKTTKLQQKPALEVWLFGPMQIKKDYFFTPGKVFRKTCCVQKL